MYNDSFQYLSVARNLLAGKGLCTSLLYFDEQLACGRMPGPQTVFPPGYPVMIAALGSVGVPLEVAAYAISIASYLLMLLLFFWAGRLLGFRGPVIGLLVLLLVSNAAGWVYALSILSESLFTAITLAALVVLMRAEINAVDREAGSVRHRIAGASLAGLSCWVRYAGLFLVAAIGLFYGVRLLQRRSQRALRDFLLVGSVSLAVVAPVLGRNFLLLGDLRGGNTQPNAKPMVEVLGELGDCCSGLVWGADSAAEPLLFGVCGTPVQLTMAALVFLGLYGLARRRSVIVQLKHPAMLLLAGFCFVYLAALLYAGKHTPISLDDPRMVYPLLPVGLLLLGAVFSAAAPATRNRRGYVLLALLVLSGSAYALAQGSSALRNVSESAQLDVSPATSAPERDSLAQWVSRHVGPAETVLANDGQAFGYTYDRQTVGLARRRYSREAWTEERLRRVAVTYRARWLILFPASADFQVVAAESAFLHSLVEGNDLPNWIQLAAARGGSRIYRLNPGSSQPEHGFQ